MITRESLARHCLTVAPTLLGCLLASGPAPRVVVRITEVEAYGGPAEDPGSHAFRRRTARNASMFGPAGRAYVYFTYGMHWCLNVVAHEEDGAGAVLIRAGEVVEGVDAARARRGASTTRDLARGPARLAAALAVRGELDGIDLLDPDSPLRLMDPDGVDPVEVGPVAAAARPAPAIRSGPRTGVAAPGSALHWRFWLADEPTVSPHRGAPGAVRRPPP